MDKKKLIDYWLSSATHDLDVAKTLFQNKKYDWCLFIGHLVIDINDFYLEARYPEQKNSFYALCTKEFTEEYFAKIEELYQWLMLQMKQ